jgi:hypothetical protein
MTMSRVRHVVSDVQEYRLTSARVCVCVRVRWEVPVSECEPTRVRAIP